MYTELGILFGVAIFAAIAREYYGNKGMFIMPHMTDKGFALGSFAAIIAAVLAVVINYGVIVQLTALTIPIAVSLGLSWGIASSDIIANVLGKIENNKNPTP